MKTLVAILGFFFLVFVGYIGVTYLNTVATVATSPARVVTKTLETNNIISNYEWYFDTNAQFETRVTQLQNYKPILAGTSDATEKSRLNIEVMAVQTTCLALGNQYNANSVKLNDGLFKDWRLPKVLDVTRCN